MANKNDLNNNLTKKNNLYLMKYSLNTINILTIIIYYIKFFFFISLCGALTSIV